MKVHTDLFVSFVDSDTGALGEELFFAASHETCLCVLCCIQYTVDGVNAAMASEAFSEGSICQKGRGEPATSDAKKVRGRRESELHWRTE